MEKQVAVQNVSNLFRVIKTIKNVTITKHSLKFQHDKFIIISNCQKKKIDIEKCTKK